MPALCLALGGFIGFALAIEATRTGSRFFFVEMREQRDQLREVELPLSCVLAGGVGVGVAALLLGAAWLVLRRLRRDLVATTAAGVLAAGAVLAVTWGLVIWLDDVTEVVQQGVHPFDVVTGDLVEADLIRGGIDFPISIAAAPTGEIFYAEHFSGRIGLLTLNSGQYEDHSFATVPKPDDARLFHLAVHPDWARQPYLYATVQRAAASGDNPQ